MNLNSVESNKTTQVLSVKLGKNKLISGDWFEACHSFASVGSEKGDFALTPEMIDGFVTNFKNNAVKRWKDSDGNFRLKINYDHWYDTKAGYIVDVEARDKLMSNNTIERALWLKADWLPDAVKANQNGYYEYFSIEYDTVYWDDQSRQKYENVLTGGALTDSPFAMELEPIALSVYQHKRKELKEEQENKKTKEEEAKKMFEKLCAALKSAGVELKADAGEADIVLKVNDIVKTSDTISKELSATKTELSAIKADFEKTKTELTEAQSKAKEYDTYKESKEKEEKEALKKHAVKELKYSPAECEESGVFGEMLNVLGAEKMKLHLEKAPVRFEQTTLKDAGEKDGEIDLTKDADYAKELKKLAEDKKISISAADKILSQKKTEQLKEKEVK